MKKVLLKISLIILGNLFAFLSVGLILDAVFKTGSLWTLLSLAVSLPVLGIIMYVHSAKILQQLHELENNDGNNTSK